MKINRLLAGTLALVLLLGISTSQAFAATGTGDDVIAENVIGSSQVDVIDVDCAVDSNVVAWVTNNGNTVGNYLTIAEDIQNNLGVTARNVAIGNSVPSCIEKLVIAHAPDQCFPSGIGAVAEAAVIDWVTNQGGELLVLEEFDGCGGGSAALTAAFGATWTTSNVITFFVPGEEYDSTEFDAAHPIMAGATIFNMVAGTSFISDGTLDTVITDSDDGNPVMLAGPINDGCVVITGDSNWPSEVGGVISLNDNQLVSNNVFNYMNNLCNEDNGVVGGELLPIDSTALLLAGLQSSAIWMLPVLAGAAGATAFYLRTRKI